jgi:hypothetical protein
MPTIEAILRRVNRDLTPQFEEKLRSFLVTQDKEWLIDQIVRLALDAHSLREMDRRQITEAKARKRAERAERLRAMRLDAEAVAAFVDRTCAYDRAKLIADGYLLATAPEKGTETIGEEHRTAEGSALLQQAKDVLFGILFGDESTGARFDRVQRELLTFALPRSKAGALDFLRASTELSAAGTWQDPDRVSDDERADNVVLEVEFGEVRGEGLGHGVVRCLSLINSLEVNEQVLYARMIDVEESTLIE